MNLLVVDDEYLVVEDLLTITDWDLLGVSKIYSAQEGEEAKSFVRNKQIDIVICDIEMPGMDGLELLKWIKEFNETIEVIMLTSHARFDYAQAALRNGSYDYLLKPIIENDLIHAIKRCYKKIELDKKKNVLNGEGLLWNEIKPSWKEFFWEDYIRGFLGDNETVKKEAIARHCEEELQKSLFPIYFCPYSTKENKINISECKRRVSAILSGVGLEFCMPYVSNNSFLFLGFMLNNNEDTFQRLKFQLCNILKTSGVEKVIGVYLGRACSSQKLIEEINKLRKIAVNNITEEKKTFFIKDDYEIVRKEADIPNMDGWGLLIEAGQGQKVISMTDNWIKKNVADHCLNRTSLQMFQYDFEQVLYTLLQENGMQAHQFLYQRKSESNRIIAVRSISEMKNWVRNLVHDVINVLNEIRDPHNLVQNTENHIKQHLEENINRINISEQMFINPDYLDRKFKEEIGFTVNQYIIKEKVKLAKHMMLRSEDISISNISNMCGYTNMSNFSAMFKREVGMSPNEYKKNVRKKADFQ